MLKFIPLIVAISIPVVSVASQKNDLNNDVATLVQEINESNAFTLYFFNSTGDYLLTQEEIKSNSGAIIYRACGRNCINTLRFIVTHLRLSTPISCAPGPGMENVFLELSTGHGVMYSHHGRKITIGNSCYFSDTSVNKILDNTDYIFK